MGNVEVVQKKDFVLFADHDSKTLAVTRIPTTTKPDGLFDVNEFRKLLDESHAKAVVTKRGNEKVLTIDSIQHPVIQGYRIYYNPVTYKIHRMLIGMARPFSLDDETGKESNTEEEISAGEDMTEISMFFYYLQLDFSSTEKLSLRKDGFNPENKFVKKEKNTFTVMPAFKDYDFMNSSGAVIEGGNQEE